MLLGSYELEFVGVFGTVDFDAFGRAIFCAVGLVSLPFFPSEEVVVAFRLPLGEPITIGRPIFAYQFCDLVGCASFAKLRCLVSG